MRWNWETNVNEVFTAVDAAVAGILGTREKTHLLTETLRVTETLRMLGAQQVPASGIFPSGDPDVPHPLKGAGPSDGRLWSPRLASTPVP